MRSGLSHVTSQPAFSTRFQNPGGLLSRSMGMPSRNDGPPDIWDTHGISGNVFANPASSSALYPQELNPWGSLIYRNQFTPHRRGRMETKHQFGIRDASPDRQPKNQSSQVRKILQRIMVQTNDCRSQIFILTNSPHQQLFLLEDKIQD